MKFYVYKVKHLEQSREGETKNYQTYIYQESNESFIRKVSDCPNFLNIENLACDIVAHSKSVMGDGSKSENNAFIVSYEMPMKGEFVEFVELSSEWTFKIFKNLTDAEKNQLEDLIATEMEKQGGK